MSRAVGVGGASSIVAAPPGATPVAEVVGVKAMVLLLAIVINS